MTERTNGRELSPRQLAAELRALVAEVEKILNEEAADPSPATVAALQERFEAAQEQVRELYAEVKDKVIAGAKVADQSIRDHPYQSLAIALGAGVLLGMLIGRRSDS